MRTVDELLKISPDKFAITVFGAEPHGNYNRIMLSPVLAGDKQLSEIIINDLQWYKDNKITLYTGKTVTQIDRINRQVIADDNSITNYDRLIIATGSVPVMLDIPGENLEGVISFRDINDVNVMIETAKTHKNAIVIGGGFLGLEAANSLMIQGMDVLVIRITRLFLGRQNLAWISLEIAPSSFISENRLGRKGSRKSFR